MALPRKLLPDRIRCLQRCLCTDRRRRRRYLLKDSDPEVLLEAIRAGAKAAKSLANASISTYVNVKCLRGRRPLQRADRTRAGCSARAAQGLSNKQIASVLNISEQTEKSIFAICCVNSTSAHAWRPHSVPATTRGTIKIARWHHHRPLFIYSPAATNVASPARYYVDHRTASIVGR